MNEARVTRVQPEVGRLRHTGPPLRPLSPKSRSGLSMPVISRCARGFSNALTCIREHQNVMCSQRTAPHRTPGRGGPLRWNLWVFVGHDHENRPNPQGSFFLALSRSLSHSSFRGGPLPVDTRNDLPGCKRLVEREGLAVGAGGVACLI